MNWFMWQSIFVLRRQNVLHNIFINMFLENDVCDLYVFVEKTGQIIKDIQFKILKT
jgi:thermostable 8-oxoguanine DNA glycosylase